MFEMPHVQLEPNLCRAGRRRPRRNARFVRFETTVTPAVPHAVPGSVTGKMATSAAPESTPQRLAAIRDQLKLLADYL
jgi:hypothetical protein